MAYHPSAFLLAAQLLSLVFFAAFEGAEGSRVVLSSVGVLLLVLVVWVVKRSPGVNWIAWVLAMMAALLSLLSWRPCAPVLQVWGALLEAALYFYATGALIAYMLGDEIVTTDELFAAGATFTLIAWGFAYLYLVCQAWFPGSFSGGPSPEKARTFMELLFLSFTNLTATGISDIMPVSAPARVLVMLEQFAGIAYLALVVSRLVSLSLLRRGRGREDRDARP
ncbi:MAG TPA: ion channel [Deltaproteobacteria bacterium]|nr:ion channel [Deltaproteobacteria bacterium]